MKPSTAARSALQTLLALHSYRACAAWLSNSTTSRQSRPRTPPPAPPTRPAPPAVPSSTNDAARYRAALEEAYAQIVARSEGARELTIVDVDAGLSMEIPDHKTIRGAVAYFAGDLHQSIQTSLNRSRRYKKTIDAALEEQKLPKGLAYLPVIESAYVETLTSRAGAHGVWQFMPDTAREYGLRVDWWVDERAAFEESTRAAAA